jgi:diamine N-acetyltransferase
VLHGKYRNYKKRGGYFMSFKSKLPNAWETERLVIRDSIPEEVNELQSIHDACSYLAQWDGEYTRDPNHLYKLVTNPPLPENGERERFKIQTLRQKDSMNIIGFFAVYQGEPTPDSLYIYTFFIHPNYQKCGYGQEVFQKFFVFVRDAGFKKVTLCTALKNFPAVRFWTRLGVNTIIKVHGDKICSENTHAQIDLQMEL